MTYTVKELIEKLKEFNPDAVVHTPDSRGKPCSNIVKIEYLLKSPLTNEDLESNDIYDKSKLVIC